MVSKLPSLSRVGKPAVILLKIPNEKDSVVATVIGKFAKLKRLTVAGLKSLSA